MAYAYAKNIKDLKKKMSCKGIICENVGRTHPRFNLGNKRQYYFRARKKHQTQRRKR